VLSPAGETMYVLGPAATGGLCAYHVGSGKLAASYSEGRRITVFTSCPAGLARSAARKPPARVFLC
jgi:hypothetical protein